jgi:hypothetical protein
VKSLFGERASPLYFDHLRQNPEGVTSRELAEAVCAHRGWDAANRDFMTAVVHKVSAQLPKLRAGGQVVSELRGKSGCGGSPTPSVPYQGKRFVHSAAERIGAVPHLTSQGVIRRQCR